MTRIILITWFWAACEQGEGARCQVQSDCSDGLICVKGTGLCQQTSSGADATFVPDASGSGADAALVDAALVDAAAMIDAAADAAIDASMTAR